MSPKRELSPDSYFRRRAPKPWATDAACAGADPALFYPTEHAGASEIRAAKRVCAGCPVRVECLHYAIDNGEAYGIWGGMTLKERRRYARKRGAA